MQLSNRDSRALSTIVLICSITITTNVVAQIENSQVNNTSEGKAALQDSQISMEEIQKLLNEAQQAILKGDEIKANEILDNVIEEGYKAWKLKLITTAETIFRQVLKLKPDNLKALFGLAELYRMTNPLWAIDYYTRYLQANPGDPAGYFGRGSCYLQTGSYTLAIQDLKYLVTRLAPDHIEGLANLALALRAKAVEENYNPDLYKEAIEYMRQAVAAATQRARENQQIIFAIPDLKYRLGRLIFEYQQIISKVNPEQADFQGAIEAFNAAINDAKIILRAQPRNESMVNQILLAYDALTEVYLNESKLKKDANIYKTLAKLAESKANMLAYSQYLKSLYYFENASKLNDKDPETWFEMAKKYAFFGIYNQAKEAIDKALTLRPDDNEYKKWLALIENNLKGTAPPSTNKTELTP